MMLLHHTAPATQLVEAISEALALSGAEHNLCVHNLFLGPPRGYAPGGRGGPSCGWEDAWQSLYNGFASVLSAATATKCDSRLTTEHLNSCVMHQRFHL